MIEPKEELKEIRLFGEKSVREEAYRQKILQLEKDLSRLETLARNSHLTNSKLEEDPERSNGLYRQSLFSFDKRAKREHDLLERRAREITERLNLQFQRLLLSTESSFRQKTRWFILSVLSAATFLILLTAIIFFLVGAGSPSFYNSGLFQNTRYIDPVNTRQNRLAYVKTALETQAKYRHQYNVDYLDLLNGIYVAEIELNAPPNNRWFLKNISSDVIDVFQRYTSGAPAEFLFLHKGKLYVKAYLTEPPVKRRLQYFY